MQEEEPEKYQNHFRKYVEEGIEPDGIEDMYKEVCMRTCARCNAGIDDESWLLSFFCQQH